MAIKEKTSQEDECQVFDEIEEAIVEKVKQDDWQNDQSCTGVVLVVGYSIR